MYPLPISLICPQRLVLTASVITYNSIRSIKDRLRRTVILLKLYNSGFLINLLKIKDVPYVGSPELIN